MKEQQHEAEDRDAALPFFSVAEADYLRELMRAELTRRGRQITVFPDHLTDTAGGSYGLWNIATDCHRHPRSTWRRMVAAHIRAGLQIDPSKDLFEGLSRQEVLRHTYVRLYATANLPDPSWYHYGRAVAPGVVELIALQRRRATVIFRDQDIERFGGLHTLREVGLGNLRTLPVEHRELMETPQGGHFRVLSGSSSFTASRVLTLDRLVQQLFGDVDTPHGVLAALPNRNEVAVHVIKDTSAVPTVINLATFAELAHRMAPGQLSRDVYWIHENRFEPVLAWDQWGQIQLAYSEDFVRLMDGLIALEAQPA